MARIVIVQDDCATQRSTPLTSTCHIVTFTQIIVLFVTSTKTQKNVVNTEYRKVVLLSIAVNGELIKLKTAVHRIYFTFVLLS